MKCLVCNFSGTYGEQGFLQWLQKQPETPVTMDFTGLEGCCCYCDCQAQEAIGESLPQTLPRLRWLDSGDYHYMSHLLALREKEPFHLVLLDNHPDNQEPAFGGVLSCGSWVKEMREQHPLLRDVLTIGPEGCPQRLEDKWLAERRGERVYVSLDKDVMDWPYARTDWSQGSLSLEQVKEQLGRLMEGMKVVAVDICGELTESKGATPEDLRINLETNIELYNYINHHLK